MIFTFTLCIFQFKIRSFAQFGLLYLDGLPVPGREGEASLTERLLPDQEGEIQTV